MNVIEIPLADAGAEAARGAVTQHYTTAIERLLPGDGILAEVIAQARRHFGHRAELVLDSQVLRINPKRFPGLPVWRSSPDGEVLAACLGDEPLMEVALGQRLEREDSDQALDGAELASATSLIVLPPRTPVRFRAGSKEQLVVVLLVRRAEGVRALNRPRFGARAFEPGIKPPKTELPAWAAHDLHDFDSRFELHQQLPPFSEAEIANEPVFYGASPAAAREAGGPIMQAFLDCLPEAWMKSDDVVILAKRDELSPGWSPALLEWHIDGSSRTPRRADGSPDLRQPRQTQYTACVGNASPMGWLPGQFRLPITPLYGDPQEANEAWKTLLFRAMDEGRAQPTTAPCNRVFHYGTSGFHAASVSQRPGWRCFLKAMHGRGDKQNLVRPERGGVAWPSEGWSWPNQKVSWPSGVFGVFPDELP